MKNNSSNFPSFAFEIKEELINKNMNKEEKKAFIDGVLFSLYINELQDIKIVIKNKFLLSSFLLLLQSTKKSFTLKNETIIFPSNNLNSIKTKTAPCFLAGLFFATGSISKLISSSYHLQISFKNENNLKKIINFASKHISFNKTQNRNLFIMYLKKHELISDFLYIIGAQKSYFKFIESVIERDHRNQITRISNLDIHNQSKLVDSHQIFLENINVIEKKKLEYKFTKEQLIFFNFKKNNPYLPLSQIVEELAIKYKIIKTKGGLNHWLIKLRKICDEFSE